MKKTLGTMIAELRKANGLTQLDLANKMGITDKAVSKWERDLSCPDISSIPTLAEILGVSVDELMQVKAESTEPKKGINEIADTALKAVGAAMGVAVAVLSVLNELEPQTAMLMLGIGLASLAISQLKD